MDGSNPQAPDSGAGILHDNATAAQEVASGSAQGCPFCSREGLPLLALRYAVVPSYLDARRGSKTLPGKLGGKVDDKTGVKYHNYTVRTLRKGFVYVYLSTPGRWMGYIVTDQGHLRLMPDLDEVDNKTDRSMSAQCERAGDNIPASFITIPEPDNYPEVWIAFATTSWTRTRRQMLEKDPSVRMQHFALAELSETPDGHEHAFGLSNPASLSELVEEYAPDEAACKARRDYTAADGSVQDQVGVRTYTWESVHGHFSRGGQQDGVCQLASRYQREHQRHAAAIVLHDAMGIVQELNATRLHFVESRQTSANKVMRPLIVSQSILGLKQVMQASILSALAATESEQGIPDVQTHAVHIPDDIGRYSQRLSYTNTRAERADKQFERTWTDLAKRYDEAKRAAFQASYDSQMQAYQTQIEAVEDDWSLWTNDASWTCWLQDYDPQKLEQRAAQSRDYALALAGGAIGPAGCEVWKSWLELSPDSPDNPIYRALFGNDASLLGSLLPADGNLHKGDKLYDTLKALLESDEFQQRLAPEWQEAIAQLQMALTGGLNAVSTRLKQTRRTLAQSTRAIALRAQQGAVMLYTETEATLLRLSITVGEYRELISGELLSAYEKGRKSVVHTLKESKRTVRSLAVSGILDIDDPKVRDAMIEVLVWTFDRATDVQRALLHLADETTEVVGDLNETAAAVGSLAAGHARNARLGLTILSDDAATQLARLRTGIRVPSASLLTYSRGLAGKSLRLAGGSNGVLAAGAVFFQGWALSESLESFDDAVGPERTSAALALLSPAVGAIGASVELAGHVLKSGLMKTAGGLIAAGATAIDAIQSAVSSAEVWSSGDKDAAVYHAGAAVMFFGATWFGLQAALGASALLGPLGIALVLIAAGVALTWMAVNAEDTQAEIWLDRCYYGYGERVEGKWADAEAMDELAALNAIMVGVSVKMGFSDDWFGLSEFFSGYDRIDVEIRIVGFKRQRAAYEWKLHVNHRKRGWIPAMSGRHRIQAPQQYISAVPRGGLRSWLTDDDPEGWFRGFHDPSSHMEGDTLVIRDSVEVEVAHFDRARIEMNYWADYADREALAAVKLLDRD